MHFIYRVYIFFCIFTIEFKWILIKIKFKMKINYKSCFNGMQIKIQK